MLRAFGFEIAEILSRLPTLPDESLLQESRVVYRALCIFRITALFRSNVEPNSHSWPFRQPLYVMHDVMIGEPDRWRHDSQTSEHFRILQAQIERDKSAQRRAAQPRVLRTRQRPIGTIDKGFQFRYQHATV